MNTNEHGWGRLSAHPCRSVFIRGFPSATSGVDSLAHFAPSRETLLLPVAFGERDPPQHHLSASLRLRERIRISAWDRIRRLSQRPQSSLKIRDVE